MIEVPSAPLGAHGFAAHADLLSTGTNDLPQHLFAAFRLNGAEADLADRSKASRRPRRGSA